MDAGPGKGDVKAKEKALGMRRTIIVTLLVGMLAACQAAPDHDPPVIDPKTCKARAVESGQCGA